MRKSRVPTVVGAGIAVGVGIALTAVSGTAYAEGSIRGTGGKSAAADSYVVVLKSSVTAGRNKAAAISEKSKSLAAKHGAKVGHTYTAALTGFSITGSEAQAKRIAADPTVAYVQYDQKLRADGIGKPERIAKGARGSGVGANDAQPAPQPLWGLDRVDQLYRPLNRNYNYTNSGLGVGRDVYVLDTGLYFQHNEFAGGRAVSGYDAIDGDSWAFDGCNGHGTHVAGTIAGSWTGVTKNAKITAVRVLDCEGWGTTSQIVAGVDWVTNNAPRGHAVVNMSLGGGPNTAIDDAIRNSIGAGITYVVSAGNDAVDACNQSPARVSEAITVAATDWKDYRATFNGGESASNYGPCVDLFAPGFEIRSAFPDPTGNGETDWYATGSGTSMAAPHVAGSATYISARYPNTTPAQVRDALRGEAVWGVITAAGAGSPNALLQSFYECWTCEFAGAADWNKDGATDLIARDNYGVLWLYPGNGGVGSVRSMPRVPIGNGFGGTTLAGVADWDRDGNQDLIYRVDGGPEAGNLYAYGSSRVLVGSGFGGVTFAGTKDLDGNGLVDVVYRVDGGAQNGWLYAYDNQRRPVGSGFAGATFAGIADWDRNGAQDVVYRIDGGGQNGHMYAYGAANVLVGTGFAGAQLADAAIWDNDGAVDLIYRVGVSLYIYGAQKYLADYGL